MKLLITALLLVPTFAFAAAKNVSLKLEESKDLSNEILCLYSSNIALGTASTIKPFQFMAQQEDGSFALLVKPNVIHQEKDGLFFAKLTTAHYIQKNKTCQASVSLLLVQ